MRLLDKAEWAFKDETVGVCLTKEKPLITVKGTIRSVSVTGGLVRLGNFTSLPFAAIKADDTEPTSRAEILGGSKE